MCLKETPTSTDKLQTSMLFNYFLHIEQNWVFLQLLWRELVPNCFTFHHLANYSLHFLPLMILQMLCMNPAHQDGVKYTRWCQIALSCLGPFICILKVQKQKNKSEKKISGERRGGEKSNNARFEDAFSSSKTARALGHSSITKCERRQKV